MEPLTNLIWTSWIHIRTWQRHICYMYCYVFGIGLVKIDVKQVNVC